MLLWRVFSRIKTFFKAMNQNNLSWEEKLEAYNTIGNEPKRFELLKKLIIEVETAAIEKVVDDEGEIFKKGKGFGVNTERSRIVEIVEGMKKHEHFGLGNPTIIKHRVLDSIINKLK